MTEIAQIAEIAPMPAIFSRLNGDARRGSRAPSREVPGANAGNPEIAYRVENTASDASVTAPPQMPEMAPISPHWRHLAKSFCRLGATDEQLAELFSVSQETIAGWMAEIPEFADAVRRGRTFADADVAQNLHRLAVGYSHTVERVFKGGRDGPVTVKYLKHYPPHPKACMDWLVNRCPEYWGRAAIKRKLQDWEDERDAAACRPPLLSPQALAGPRARRGRARARPGSCGRTRRCRRSAARR